jgi:hypothetical protein
LFGLLCQIEEFKLFFCKQKKLPPQKFNKIIIYLFRKRNENNDDDDKNNETK